MSATASALSRKDRLLTRVSRNVARIHTTLFRFSDGRFGRRFRGGDVLLLTVRGRRSGRAFTTPLLHVRDGRDYIVAASNGGIDCEPQWWLNLLADPHGEVEAGEGRVRVTASEAQGEERGLLWARLVESFSGYEDYQAAVRRRIAVVRLSPVPATDAPSASR
ncbi:nitroreductase/quinone reductase family protein [Planobispora siamensis]|uniref:Deazaflavin-dependent oxidoreductase, nitroreductase family n=1 Tax=Planobispora siamensis TaxID=936338 RepID=A0A8J3WK96_9ACTN|nr:nitroreductase/quinone reductase family protein [Planobispora siamensis]GIH90601.1 hypothetical protein Psi01_12310 [Planobispora siamensis]